MYEIRMNGGKKMILDLILDLVKLEFLRDRSKRKGIDKFHLELWSFFILSRIENSLYTIIMILHIPIRLDIRKINGFGI